MLLILRALVFFLSALNIHLIHGDEGEQCDTLEIRNYKDLDALDNCTVIFGNLALLFPPIYEYPEYTVEEINERIFPLREITGFMVVYSLTHLNSLGHMFPNLTVIRGHRLFSNYALVIYETDIAEITFRNLLKISRGSVRIDSNSRLCLPKIDWDSIMVSGKLVMGINSTVENCTDAKFERCGSCPEPFKCWHNGACQRFEKTFLAGPRRRKVCHSLCLGDCWDSTVSGCYTCKDLSDNSTCLEKCPDTKLLNIDTRRCIKIDDCIRLNRTIHETFCLQECPSGFSTQVNISDDNKNMTNHHCQKCREKCPKFCAPPEIRRVSHLESIGTGCTIITGDLEINIIDDISNLTQELQTYLGDVEEIWGVLKIHRSPPITELTFLNRLRIVEGKKNKTSILIFENQNLQTIFNWQSRANIKLKLKNGYLQIYSNILLCNNETKRFQEILDRSENYTSDLIQNNGAKNKCTANTIETKYVVYSHDACRIQWKDLNNRLKRRFNAYIIQYVPIKSSKFIDEKFLLERDSCSSYGWQHVYVKREDSKVISNNQLEYNLTGLSHFTLYAYSIQTYLYGTDEASIQSLQTNPEYDGAISAVKTFRTMLRVPSRVKNLFTKERKSNSITLQWEVVENEESAIQFFFADVIKKPFNQTLIERRNYCVDPIKESETKNTESIRTERFKGPIVDDRNTCCERCCKFFDERNQVREKEDNDFRAHLLKYSERVDRESFEPRLKIKKLPYFVARSTIESKNRTYTVTDLEPYTLYTFYFHACSSDTICGEFEIHSETTLMDDNETFDQVVLKPTSYIFESHHFHVYFFEPALKNGVVINYNTELWEVGSNTSKLISSNCVTNKQHEANGYKFSDDSLIEGTYRFRVMAVVLARQGKFSPFHQFQIVRPDQTLSKGWIILGVFTLLLLACVLIIAFYQKHKIIMLFKRQNDNIVLMRDIEPTDYHNISLRHGSIDGLSDINESDE